MRQLVVVLGASFLLLACKRSGSHESASSSPSASASAAMPPATGDPKDMRTDLEDLTGFLDTAVRVCQRSGAPAETMKKLRDAQAATYADRDELVIRTEKKSLGDRDLVDWHRHIKLRVAEVNILARPCAK